ncbi:MAG: FAD-binding protein [Clostridia bacterium]|nr:FAD-binding protein [Clostridia bacterium]
MFIRLHDIKTGFDEGEYALKAACAEALKVGKNSIEKITVRKRSLDARRGRPIMYTYTADVVLQKNVRYSLPQKAELKEYEEKYELPKVRYSGNVRPVVVGAGPAGLFCALVLAECGLRPVMIERGKCVEERVRDVEEFFSKGVLNTSSNIQFGEGGAGTFSDGKLNTLVKDREHRGRFVLENLVQAGAPEEILYVNKPHVGTDMLRRCIQNIRKRIETLGGTVLFEHTLINIIPTEAHISGIRVRKGDGTEFVIDTDTVFLGVGHSARDTFHMLQKSGIPMEQKPFAVGVRIEHKQELINDIQYNGIKNKKLPAADYKLVCHTSGGRTVYTFCMCPGGEVVAAASEEGMVVTNGMSNFKRNGENANSALLVEVRTEDFGSDDVLAGVEFQRELEKRAYIAGGGGYTAPAQSVADFLDESNTKPLKNTVVPTYSRGVRYVDLHEVLPEFITEALSEGLHCFDDIMHGFAGDAVMTAVESRSSSPVRILRDKETLQSALHGLFPMGEGAGYAGGIMSAAMDGMKAAEAYIHSLNGKQA